MRLLKLKHQTSNNYIKVSKIINIQNNIRVTIKFEIIINENDVYFQIKIAIVCSCLIVIIVIVVVVV